MFIFLLSTVNIHKNKIWLNRRLNTNITYEQENFYTRRKNKNKRFKLSSTINGCNMYRLTNRWWFFSLVTFFVFEPRVKPRKKGSFPLFIPEVFFCVILLRPIRAQMLGCDTPVLLANHSLALSFSVLPSILEYIPKPMVLPFESHCICSVTVPFCSMVAEFSLPAVWFRVFYTRSGGEFVLNLQFLENSVRRRGNLLVRTIYCEF